MGRGHAAHHVECNNINSDLWVLEHVYPTLFAEPSLDACDHYHGFRDDIRFVVGLGLNTYRFSIEWARIEPERHHFSLAELDHYCLMLAACHENGVTPRVTFSHFSSPRWFAASGGGKKAASMDLFVRYCERASRHFGDLIGLACTFNEPNLPMQLRWISNEDIPITTVLRTGQQAAKAVGSGTFGCFFLGDAYKLQNAMISAHHRAPIAMKWGPGDYPVGVNISVQDDQAVGPKSKRDKKCAEIYDPWLAAAAQSDFLGLQTYTRCRVGKGGDLVPESGIELTQNGV